MEAERLRGEAWAKDQIERDQPIRFPADWPEADRSVSGAFVLDAIVDARWAKVPEGFLLAHAVVTTPVERRYAHVQGELTFEDCTFAGDVRLPYAKFERRVRFLGGAFAACFDLYCGHTADLEFGGSVEHRPTIFRGQVNFPAAEIGGQLNCDKARFLSEKGTANFNACKVRGTAFFREAAFHGPVNLVGAEIGRQLVCGKTQFLSEEWTANFSICTVRGTAFFEEATFHGPVDFSGAEIGGDLRCDKTQFRSEIGTANFNGCKISGLARFEEATFHGPVNFVGAEIGRQLNCDKAQFLSAEGEADFNGCTVKGTAFFREAAFHGPVDFATTEIGINLRCEKAQFCSKNEAAKFNGFKVSGEASFEGATFHGPVKLSFCKLSSMWLADAQFANSLDLSNTSIAGTLSVCYPKTGVKERVKSDIKLPPAADLRGMTYDRTDLESGDNWKAWISLRRNPDSYDAGPFFTLERSFRRAGRDDVADKIHYEMRRVEARQLWRLRRFDKVLWNWFLRGAVGYGVYGYRLIVWAVALLAASYLAIRWAHGADFIKAAKGEPALPFSPFLYMVNLLLFNVTSLGKQYQPVGAWAFAEVAVRLLGWILVPLALAQLAGLVKKKE